MAEEDNGEWVVVRRPAEKDWWRPSGLTEYEDDNDDERPLKVMFTEPAKHWTDAIPMGNGRIGAMIFGGVASETIRINEDTLWTGIPGNYTNPDAPASLTQVRKLVDDGKFAEATAEAVKLSGMGSEVYQVLGDIKLEFDDSHLNYDKKTYYRELDLNTATARVRYSIDDVVYTREHFASNPDQAILTKVASTKPGSVSFTVSLDSELLQNSYTNGENQIFVEGNCPGRSDPKGIQFTAGLSVQISEGRGKMKVLDDRKLQVEGSDWAVLTLVASSSFDGPFTRPAESKKDPTKETLKALKIVRNISFKDLYAHHLEDYQSLFHRVSLRLSKTSKTILRSDDLSLKGSQDIAISTAERVKSFKTDEDPSLVELLFQYGRYLLISCSRPGTQVANLQGIWSKDNSPPWDDTPHMNINLQMNYWPALPCNLHECQEPLFDYMSSLSVNGSKTAKVNYDANGWVVHQVSDIWAKTSPDRGEAVWALWPMGGAWLCTHLWEHYTYTMDKDFLKNKAYPLLEGCTTFLLDWLIEGPRGFLETNPSTSPEHMFIAPDGKPASVSYSTTMDVEIIQEVFSEIVSAAEILGRKDDELIQKVLQAQPRLRPVKIARDGSITEWAQDFEDPDVHHRHVSHLFGLFPGHTITPEKTPDLCKAADYTLFKRGDDGPGWSTMWKAALWARLRDREGAYRMIKHLFDLVDPDRESDFEGGLYSNLFTAHPPFQIDANFGFPAAIAEMLVQSTLKDLYLLPALPRDKWANGCVKGLKARSGLTVNICWSEGDLHEVGLWSKEHHSITRLHYRGNNVNARISSGRVYTFNRQLKCVKTYSLAEVASV